MKTFNIEIKEILSRIIKTDGTSLENAIDAIKKQYDEEKIILDSNDFVDVEIIEEEKQTKNEKTITLKQLGYEISGEVIMNLWGGGQGKIAMKNYTTKTKEDKEIIEGINDNEHGCESIEKASIIIDELYEDNYVRLIGDTREYTYSQLVNTKKGI